MNEKRSAICRLTFYEISAVSFESIIGERDARLMVVSPGIALPVVGASLAENRSATGGFVDVELSARITDTSASMENTILQCTDRYGVLLLEYTDATKRVLGTKSSPILMTYEKSGIPVSFVLSVKGTQPELSKITP